MITRNSVSVPRLLAEIVVAYVTKQTKIFSTKES